MSTTRSRPRRQGSRSALPACARCLIDAAVRGIRILGVLCIAGLAGCSAVPLVTVPSANQDSRVSVLVLHFTSENFAESLRLLTQPGDAPVSAHYLVPAPEDASYPRARLRVYRLVPEARRAWHAGRSAWAGRTELNASSIGVEIVNPSRCSEPASGAPDPGPEGRACDWAPFPDAQIELLIPLLQDLLARHPEIAPEDVVGHADVAPTRRVDPGPLFPWQRLHEAGIGAWYEPATVARWRGRFDAAPPPPALLRAALAAWGYSVDPCPPDADGEPAAATRYAIAALQMHFRPAAVTGRFDPGTAAILFALLERYRPRALAELESADFAGPGATLSDRAASTPAHPGRPCRRTPGSRP